MGSLEGKPYNTVIVLDLANSIILTFDNLKLHAEYEMKL